MNFSVLHLKKAFGEKQVLQDVSFSMKKGERLILMGPSGCGKTTLCRILAGLEIPDSGRIEGFSTARCSMVFQEDRLILHKNAVDNLLFAFPKKLEKSQIHKALSTLGLHTSDLQIPARKLSGGQKRRVALARAFLAPSDFIILDEPFKGLDAENKERAIHFIKHTQGDRALLCVTHEEEEARQLSENRFFLSESKN